MMLSTLLLTVLRDTTSHSHSTAMLSTDLSMAMSQSDVENLVKSCLIGIGCKSLQKEPLIRIESAEHF